MGPKYTSKSQKVYLKKYTSFLKTVIIWPLKSFREHGGTLFGSLLWYHKKLPSIFSSVRPIICLPTVDSIGRIIGKSYSRCRDEIYEA
jgi:hypothetical protein